MLAVIAAPRPRRPQRYDHRLRDLVRTTGDRSLALALGVPRSTVAGWLNRKPQPVPSHDLLALDPLRLQAEILALRRRLERVSALCRVLVLVVRLATPRLHARRLGTTGTTALVRAVERARGSLPLATVLAVLRVPASRFRAWARERLRCRRLSEHACLRRQPNQLTPDAVVAIRRMVTDPAYRHVPTGRLSLLAQRLGSVLAAPSTWYRLIRIHGWRRPRARRHPAKPMLGLRAERPNQIWHIDTTIVRLLDGSKAYLHAVIDNFSRKILAYRVAARFEISSCVAVLRQALAVASAEQPPLAVMDGGIENYAP